MGADDKENYKKILGFVNDLSEIQTKNLAEAIELNPDDVKDVLSHVFDGTLQRCLGKCPKCGAPGEGMELVINWNVFKWEEAPGIYQKAHCTNCGTDFTEYYIYAGTEIKE